MKLSDKGLFALAVHEAIVPGPYLDSVGVWTYGIGHTKAAGDPDPAKMRRGMPDDMDAAIADVLATFRKDVAKYEAAVARAVKVPLTQSQFDALVSWHYNTGAVATASLVKKLNAGDYAGAGNGFMAWLKPASLKARRESERDLFMHGKYPSGPVAVWGVTDAGKVIWKASRRLSFAEFIDMLSEKPAPQRPAPIPAPTPTTNPLGPLARLIAALLAMFKKGR